MPRYGAMTVAYAEGIKRRHQSAAVIKMPVRQHDALDPAEIDGEPFAIPPEGIRLRAGVE